MHFSSTVKQIVEIASYHSNAIDIIALPDVNWLDLFNVVNLRLLIMLLTDSLVVSGLIEW